MQSVVITEVTRISTFEKFKGFTFVFIGGLLLSVSGAVAKYLKHIPVGEFVFLRFLMAFLLVAPPLFLLQPKINYCGKFGWIAIRCLVGAVAGIIKYWSFIRLDFADAVALYATTPIFAGIFSRILVKEKINIFTILAASLGFSGIIFIVQPSVFFGASEKGYSWFAIVTIFGAMCLGFSFSTLRKIGSDVHYLVIPFHQYSTMSIFAVGFYFSKAEDLILPGCFEERVIIFVSSVTVAIAFILINRGMAIERTGPVTLVRNLDTVYAYVIQIVFFKKSPELLTYVGAGLILVGTMIITLSKMFLHKCNLYEI